MVNIYLKLAISANFLKLVFSPLFLILKNVFYIIEIVLYPLQFLLKIPVKPGFLSWYNPALFKFFDICHQIVKS